MNYLSTLLLFVAVLASNAAVVDKESNLRGAQQEQTGPRRALMETVAKKRIIPEGESIKCLDISDTRVFRYTGGVLRPYPDQFIAFTYDVVYNEEILTYLDCTVSGFGFGPPMDLIIAEGRNVICTDGPSIFKWTDGVLHHYPDETVATSWDPNWKTNLFRLDCDYYGLTQGSPEDVYVPEEGSVIICLEDERRVYRWADGQLHHFIDGAVANSWDFNWRNHAMRKMCLSMYPNGDELTSTVH